MSDTLMVDDSFMDTSLLEDNIGMDEMSTQDSGSVDSKKDHQLELDLANTSITQLITMVHCIRKKKENKMKAVQNFLKDLDRAAYIEGDRLFGFPELRKEFEIIRKKLSIFLETPHHHQGLIDAISIAETELQRCSDLHVKCIELQPEDEDFISKVFPAKIKVDLDICDSDEAQVSQNIAQLVAEINVLPNSSLEPNNGEKEQALKLSEIRTALIKLKRKYLVMLLKWWERMNKNNYNQVSSLFKIASLVIISTVRMHQTQLYVRPPSQATEMLVTEMNNIHHGLKRKLNSNDHEKGSINQTDQQLIELNLAKTSIAQLRIMVHCMLKMKKKSDLWLYHAAKDLLRYTTIEGDRLITLPDMGMEIEIIREKLSTFLETSHQGLDTSIVETALKRCSELHMKCVELNQEEDADFNRPTFDFPRKLKADIKQCNSGEAQVNQNIEQLVLKIDSFKAKIIAIPSFSRQPDLLELEQALELETIRNELLCLQRKYLVMLLEWWKCNSTMDLIKAPSRFKIAAVVALFSIRMRRALLQLRDHR